MRNVSLLIGFLIGIVLCGPAQAAQDAPACVTPVMFFQKTDGFPEYDIGTVVPLNPAQVSSVVALYNAHKQPPIQANGGFVVQLVDPDGNPAPKVVIGVFQDNCLQGVVAMPFDQAPTLGI